MTKSAEYEAVKNQPAKTGNRPDQKKDRQRVDVKTDMKTDRKTDQKTDRKADKKTGGKANPASAQKAGIKSGRKAGSKSGPAGTRQSPPKKTGSGKSAGGFSHPDYDAAVLDCFLEKQLQLFPETVATTPEEAADFLEMCFAVVVRSKRDVRRYFEEVGTDVEGEDLFSAAEVFPVGDGRYLIVEG